MLLTFSATSTVELTVGIICACLPTLAPLYSRKILNSLIPDSLRSLFQSWRRASKNIGSSNRRSMSKHAYVPHTDSNVELVNHKQKENTQAYTAPGGHNRSSSHGIMTETTMNVDISHWEDASDGV